jgi:hypothetical protein
MDFSVQMFSNELFEVLLDTVFHHTASVVGASRAVLRINDTVRMEIGQGIPDGPKKISLPARNRDHVLIGVAEFTAKAGGTPFTQADERALRDFERPFGILVEVYKRTIE